MSVAHHVPSGLIHSAPQGSWSKLLLPGKLSNPGGGMTRGKLSGFRVRPKWSGDNSQGGRGMTFVSVNFP